MNGLLHRYFFTEGVRLALKKGLQAEAGRTAVSASAWSGLKHNCEHHKLELEHGHEAGGV